ncbi:serine/threonine-protein kinase [Baaleninema simplex]|uniref:serine/threonine-protein kinase n=1 Tax=Baaleninema simplex TaxID=2862350 RepID=UPI000349D337|nr:serine/threonine-protein kinase [Baaleninema simplex]
MIFCLNPDCSHPRNLDDATHCLSCGSRLKLRGRYRPTKPLAQGGFGRTYLAVDEDRLNTFCVIKQLLPQGTGSDATPSTHEKTIELFYQEATQLSLLGEHPNIPTLFAFFEEESRLYLVQEYIDGHTLWHELEQNGAFSEAQIKEVFAQLLPVLRFVHRHQVVHRDITPVNILRRQKDGRLMLIDFGVSKQLTRDTLSEPGTKVGTVGYAPLEQLRSGIAYPASDIYSLGVTCIQLLTNARPDTLFDPLKGWRWREKLASQHRSVGDRLGRILDKTIQERLVDRYQSVDEIVRDFKSPHSKKPARRRRVKNAVATGSPTTNRLPETAVEGPSSGRSRTTTPQPLPPHPSRPLPSDPPPTRREESEIAPISHAPPLPTTRGWHCAYTLPAPTSLITSVALSPGEQWVVGGCLDNSILVWNLRTKKLQHTLSQHRRPVNAVAISPDEAVLASGSDDATIKLWNLHTGQLINTLSGHLRGVTSVVFAADGSFLASGSKDRTVQIWEPKQSQASTTLTARSGSIKTIAVSPDGRWLATGGLDNKIHLWDLRDRTLIHTLSGHLNSVLAVAISPDGKQLASGSKDRTVKLWDLETGTELETLSGHLWDVNAIAYIARDRALVTASNDKTIKVWSLHDYRVRYTLSGHMGAVQGVAVSADGTTIVSGSWDKTIKVWNWHGKGSIL